MKVVRKPPSFDAIQFTVMNWEEVCAFVERGGHDAKYVMIPSNCWVEFDVTRDGEKNTQRVWANCFVVLTENGIEVYSPEIFARRFEIVS